jgi:POT family proton-dependent oligopeptide transporter
MFISTVILWIGRKRYVMVPPSPPDPHSFLNVSRTALASGRAGQLLAALGGAAALGSLLLVPSSGVVIALCTALVALLAFGGIGVWIQIDGARGRHPDEAVEGVRSVLRVLVLFALVTPFWSLFDQKASTWVLQANAMTKPTWFQSSQMQALNPLLVMLLIPFNNLVLFPALKRAGWEMTALRRITIGIAFSGLSWVVVGAMQVVLDGGHAFSIAWQVLPYALLTLGEVLVSATGLEFAYSQAPQAMKGVLMSFWLLSVTIGNLWVLVVNAGVKNAAVTNFIASTGFGTTAFQMFFFAAFAFVAALVFGLCARSYQVVDHYRKA